MTTDQVNNCQGWEWLRTQEHHDLSFRKHKLLKTGYKQTKTTLTDSCQNKYKIETLGFSYYNEATELSQYVHAATYIAVISSTSVHTECTSQIN
jgi:adenosylcobinamide amidohydrolase